MSFQLYITRLKCLFRNKESMFWCYLFPLLLTTCFYFAFNNFFSMDEFKTIAIAYDNDLEEVDILKDNLNAAKMSDGTPMFSVTYCENKEAEGLLEEGKIEAYIVGSSNPMLYVKENGMNETIVKSFLDSYLRMSETVHTILEKNPGAMNEGLMEDVMQHDGYVYEEVNENKPDVILSYFYALLAYTCIFAAFWGQDEVINIQADQSKRGARLNAAPISKMKLFFCNLLAAFTAHCGSLILVFLYMYFGLKINFGDHILYILITCIIGSLAGLSIGATTGAWLKKSPETKEAVLTGILLGGSFLSGMMIVDIKYIIATKLPLLAYINPVSLVSDSFYSLYYYDTFDRFLLNMLLLSIFTVIFSVVAYIGIRRKTYASI